MADLKFPELNQVIVSGRLTRDPELRYIPSGAAVCSFALAVTSSYKDKAGGRQEKTTYIDCKCWSGSAEYVGSHVEKGDPVIVTGSIESESWEDKATGQKRSKSVILARNIQTLSWKENSSGGGQQRGGYSDAPKPRPIEEPIPADDIPF